VTTTAPHKAARPARNGDLAAIHMAKAQLQLSDDEYRDLMATVCNGIRSAAQLDWTGRRRFLAHLQACLKHRQAPGTARHIKAPLTPAQRLMWSLWMRLADAGQVGDRTMTALEAFAQRQTGVQRLQWLNKQQEDLVIVSLKAWIKRGGAE
jgi:phage gp16-like protein